MLTLKDIIDEEGRSGKKHHKTRSAYSRAILNLLLKADPIPDKDGWIFVGCIQQEYCRIKKLPFTEKPQYHWVSILKPRYWKSQSYI